MSVTDSAPAGDVRRGAVDQPLRGVPADGGHLADRRVDAEPLGELAGRRGPGAGHDVDHAQPLDAIPQRREPRRTAASQARCHEVDRGDRLGPLDRLARGDDDREAFGVGRGGHRERWRSSGQSGSATRQWTEGVPAGASYHPPLRARRAGCGQATGPADDRSAMSTE